MDPAVDLVVDDLRRGLRGLLGRELVGLYLVGSAATGDFVPGVSDVDLVAVLEREAANLDLAALATLYREVVERCPEWTDRIEVVHVGRRALAEFRTSRSRLAVISPGEPLHLRSDAVVEWTQNWYLLRATGLVLEGPPQSDLVPTIAWPEFVGATILYVDELVHRDLSAASAGSLAYTLLTVCRASMTAASGRTGSKRAGAAWAMRQYPDHAMAIQDAIAGRLAHESVGFEEEQARGFARAAIEQIGDDLIRMPQSRR